MLNSTSSWFLCSPNEEEMLKESTLSHTCWWTMSSLYSHCLTRIKQCFFFLVFYLFSSPNPGAKFLHKIHKWQISINFTKEKKLIHISILALGKLSTIENIHLPRVKNGPATYSADYGHATPSNGFTDKNN